MTGDPSIPADTKPVYIGFWLRFLAFCIDNIWIPIVIVPVMGLFPGTHAGSTASTPSSDAADMQKLMKILQDTLDGNPPDTGDLNSLGGLGDVDLSGFMNEMLISVVIITIVFALCWWLTGSTPGKWVIRAKVVNATTLKKPSFGRSLVRGLAYYASLLPFCLGFIWIGLDRKKRGFHDLIAGTVVVRKSGWLSRE